MHMRMHIELDDDLVAKVDDLTGPRGRSAFMRTAIATAVRQQERRSRLEAAAGVLSDSDHDWDHDPAEWVRSQRRGDARRAG